MRRRVDDSVNAVIGAVDSGATVLVPLLDNGAIEFANLTDPHGNRFGLWRPKV